MFTTPSEAKWREWYDTDARRLLECQLDLPPVSLVEYKVQLEDVLDFKDITRMIPFAVENLEGDFVGWINLFKGDPQHGVFSFGISVFREHQRQGYAADAVHLVLRYGFHELRMNKCNSACLAYNQASIDLHKKLGFVEEGRRRKIFYMDGRFHDEVLFGMLVEEFDDGMGRE